MIRIFFFSDGRKKNILGLPRKTFIALTSPSIHIAFITNLIRTNRFETFSSNVSVRNAFSHKALFFPSSSAENIFTLKTWRKIWRHAGNRWYFPNEKAKKATWAKKGDVGKSDLSYDVYGTRDLPRESPFCPGRRRGHLPQDLTRIIPTNRAHCWSNITWRRGIFHDLQLSFLQKLIIGDGKCCRLVYECHYSEMKR